VILSSCLNLFSICFTVKSHNHYKNGLNMIFYGFKLSQEMFDTTTNHKKLGGFSVNCGVMDGDLRRLKEISEALWLIYAILKRKSLHQILQIFIFYADRSRTLWMKNKLIIKLWSPRLNNYHILNYNKQWYS
jgi:hypothetical protein